MQAAALRHAARITDSSHPAPSQFPSTRPMRYSVEHLIGRVDVLAYPYRTQGERHEALYATTLWLGLRRGEVLGLRWQDIDLDKQSLYVEMAQVAVNGKLQLAPPKTKMSRRELPIPDSLAYVLRAHILRQAEEQLRAGSRWRTHGLVFCSSIGTPLQPRNVVRDFKLFLNRAELPDIRFHDLRHSCGSLLVSQNVQLRVIQAILGHTNIATTQRYTHIYDESKREAANAMDRLLGGKREAA